MIAQRSPRYASLVWLMALSLAALSVSLESGSTFMRKLRRIGTIGNLREIVSISKSTNPLDADFQYALEGLEKKGQLKAPIEKSVSSSLTWKDRVELLPYMGSAFFGVTISSLVGSYLPLEMAAGAELVFAAYCFSLVKSSLQKPVALEAMPEYDRDWDSLWTDVFDSLPDVRQWLVDWFLDSAFEDICREDVDEFFTWAMYSTTLENIDDEQKAALSMAVKLLEQRCDYTFPQREGVETKVRSMRSTIEPLQWFHKPLIFYLLTQGVASQALRKEFKGFEQKKIGELVYWTGASTITSKTVPVVFYHGVGGLVYYTRFLRSLEAAGIPVVAVEMPYVSLHIAPNVPTIDEHTAGFCAILDELGVEKAIVIGHSWGSNVISWLCQAAEDRIAASIFLDPVVFMLHLRNITYNWFYKDTSAVKASPYGTAAAEGETTYSTQLTEPDTGGGVMSLIKSELFTNHALQRPYMWFRNVLFAHEMEKKSFSTTICLSELDPIVPSDAVKEHVLAHRAERRAEGLSSQVEVKVLPGATHGSFVFEKDYQRSVVDLIKNIAKTQT